MLSGEGEVARMLFVKSAFDPNCCFFENPV